MRAAYYERKGPPHEVIKIGDLPTPEPGPGEVRVRIRVSAVNPSDTKQRSGWGGGMDMPFARIVPHQDGAGEIDRVGPGVPDSRLGERVWLYEAQRDGRAFGTAAEYAVVPATNAVRLPDGASFDDGASLGVPGMTAHRLLFGAGAVHGKTVLVAGGAGSVGHMAVQLARWAGAQVIATVGSDGQAEVARASGAHHVLNYKTDDVIERIRAITGADGGVDQVIEVAFAKNLALDAAVLKPSGTIATYMIDEDLARSPTLNLQQLLVKEIAVRFTLVYAMPPEAHKMAARDLNAALAAGALKPRIARRFQLGEIADAHELLGTPGMGGKAVIDIGT
jgi:NADPH2:quinone reductase